jgi:hypothetical protein
MNNAVDGVQHFKKTITPSSLAQNSDVAPQGVKIKAALNVTVLPQNLKSSWKDTAILLSAPTLPEDRDVFDGTQT